MQLSGNISKMHTHLNRGVAQYQLPIGDKLLSMNDLVGEEITLSFDQTIHCQNCGKQTNKSYSQGHCYPCSQKLASCDLCIMKPETCHYHLGTCREPQWGLDNCFSPHVIYLANSSGAKVGITRKRNIPSRWIDQGAINALPILEVDTRLKSGELEMALKQFVNDKTNWRQMLKNEVTPIDLLAIRDQLLSKIGNTIESTGAQILDNEALEINYPVVEYPSKISSLNFDKTPTITGVLKGIKAQYLILESGVLNIRKFSGYNITITY
ncbi:MAG: DUF2797 domain-containing protein [Candidatus Thioglobus sp.]|uniref:DUF2797 domain-containing protein n=1 Tax=Candidatus Thioglobus sp. TaxID=2026721 RepID=UPI0026061537|nr:DUF2797 domain-containing protein [Candidatus Thioglobus sp.]MDC9726328.1 DUF2797 domain-containing protein [Candidatus Thioglobus sp.]